MKKYPVIARSCLKRDRGNLSILKKGFSLMTFFIIFNCSENPENYIQHLEGYWEIESVTMPNGDKKDYSYNETIDYISFNDSLQGFRKKLKPSINDTYFTSDDAEALKIKVENDSLNIYYSTSFSKWKETVLNASENELKVINENEIVYLYKRYEPINLDL